MNYIVRYTGSGRPSAAKLKKLLADHQLKVLDSSSLPDMVLVEGMKAAFMTDMNKAQPGWKSFPQSSSVKLPDTRRKVSK